MIGRVVTRSVGNPYTSRQFRLSLRRAWSWSDINPVTYISSGYQSAKSYWYGSKAGGNSDGGSGAQGGKADSSNSIELSTVSDPVPVFLDLSSIKRDDEEEETLAKIQNLGRVSLLVILRFRKHILKAAAKYIKVLFEDHYEYMLLIIMFFLL